jgi:LPXTG-motif cell wall-anchored protein
MHGGAGLVFQLDFRYPDGTTQTFDVPGNTTGGGIVTDLAIGDELLEVRVYLGSVLPANLIETIIPADIAHRNDKDAHMTNDGSMGPASSGGTREVNSGRINFWYRGGVPLNNGDYYTQFSPYGLKTVEGATLAGTAGIFSFEVYEIVDGDRFGPVCTGTNDEFGNIFFEAIEYDEEGTHTYVMSEVQDPMWHWTLDDSEFTFTVEVVIVNPDDTNLAILVAYPDYDDITPTFFNEFDPLELILEAEKLAYNPAGVELPAGTLTDGQFEFAVYRIINDDGDLSAAPVATGTNDASGLITFSPIELIYDDTQLDSFYFAVMETSLSGGGWTVDDAIFRVGYGWESTEDGCELVLMGIFLDDFQYDFIAFINTRDNPPPPPPPNDNTPKTGDLSQGLYLFAGLLLVVGVAATAISRKQTMKA